MQLNSPALDRAARRLVGFVLTVAVVAAAVVAATPVAHAEDAAVAAAVPVEAPVTSEAPAGGVPTGDVQAAYVADPSDVVFAERPGQRLRLDVRSKPERRGAPIVILVHGGGWWYGTRRDMLDAAPVAASFVEAGFVAVGIDYRLACGTNDQPRRRYGVNYTRGNPLCGAYISDQVQDVQDAVRYVKAHAAQWGGDPNRVTLLGSSAGGHLALLAAATAPIDAQVRAVANWSGPSSNKFIAQQDPSRKPSIVSSFTNAVGCMWQGSRECKAKWDAVSPYARVVAGGPRFAVLAMSGAREQQVPASTHRQFDAKLRRLGYVSRVISLDSTCHGTGCRRRLVIGPTGVRTVEATTISFLEANSR